MLKPSSSPETSLRIRTGQSTQQSKEGWPLAYNNLLMPKSLQVQLPQLTSVAATETPLVQLWITTSAESLACPQTKDGTNCWKNMAFAQEFPSDLLSLAEALGACSG